MKVSTFIFYFFPILAFLLICYYLFKIEGQEHQPVYFDSFLTQVIQTYGPNYPAESFLKVNECSHGNCLEGKYPLNDYEGTIRNLIETKFFPYHSSGVVKGRKLEFELYNFTSHRLQWMLEKKDKHNWKPVHPIQVTTTEVDTMYFITVTSVLIDSTIQIDTLEEGTIDKRGPTY